MNLVTGAINKRTTEIRNHVNYGSASAIARIMTDFGHNVHIPVWDDNGFLRIPKIVIDGEVFIDFEKSE